jgi:hypothetical protein
MSITGSLKDELWARSKIISRTADTNATITAITTTSSRVAVVSYLYSLVGSMSVSSKH